MDGLFPIHDPLFIGQPKIQSACLRDECLHSFSLPRLIKG